MCNFFFINNIFISSINLSLEIISAEETRYIFLFNVFAKINEFLFESHKTKEKFLLFPSIALTIDLV